ncbi:MAG: OmpA family protein, partial [Deltaproteobacteria bacterium]
IAVLLTLLVPASAAASEELRVVPELHVTLGDGEARVEPGPAWRAVRWTDPAVEQREVAHGRARMDWARGQVVVDTRIEFAFDRATLREDAEPLLDEVAAVLAELPGLAVRIEGHTDDVGAHGYNLRLSEDRAAAVRAALIARGVEAERLSTRGLGPTVPLDPAGTQEARERNRRVEFHVATAPDRRQRIAFLLDASTRTRDALRSAGDPSALLAERLGQLQAMLAPLVEADDARVSLWVFSGRGDAFTVQALPGAEDLSPGEASARLGELLRADRLVGAPGDAARATHAAARTLLGLPADPSQPVPETAPRLTVFVLSGGEVPAGEAAAQAWRERHVATHQLHWVPWPLEDGAVGTPPDDRALYLVQWGSPSRLRSLNRLSPPADPEVPLSPWPWLTVSRAVTHAGLGEATRQCLTPGEALADGPGRLDYRLELPAPFPLARLDEYADGAHALRPDIDRLCEALGRELPGARLAFPTRADGSLSPLGLLEVISLQEAVVRLEGADGVADAHPAPVTFDRLHRARGSARSFRVTAPEVADAPPPRVRWTARLLGDGEQPDRELLRWDGSADGAIVWTPGEVVTLAWPARPQRWHAMGGDFRADPGAYPVEVCATLDWPEVRGRADVRVDLACGGCRDARRVSDDQVCMGWVQRVERRPLAWWWIALILLVVGTVLWVVIRWRTSATFPRGLCVGNARIDAAMRRQRIDFAQLRFLRRPLYIRVAEGRLREEWARPGVTVLDASCNAAFTARGASNGALPGLALLPASAGVRIWAVRPARDPAVSAPAGAGAEEGGPEGHTFTVWMGDAEVPMVAAGAPMPRGADLLRWSRLRDHDAEGDADTTIVISFVRDGAGRQEVRIPVWIRP